MALPRRMRHRLLQLLILQEAEDRDAMLAVVARGRLQEAKKEALLGEAMADQKASVRPV